MAGFNNIPAASGGGGGIPSMTFVGSIHMTTYNRSWAQAGVAGNYAIYSADKQNGYAYFVGTGTTTGIPMNRMGAISHAFTRIDIVAPQNDIVSLYKVKTKATTLFSNPLASMTKNSAVIIASGNFELPSNATVPFADILVCGAGGGGGSGHGATHGGGGGGGGGNVVNLTDYPIYGTTIVSVGFGGTPTKVSSASNGGQSAFGPVYALGGGGGGGWSDRVGKTNGNGGGAGAGGSGASSPGSGTTQTSTTGLGTIGSPTFNGGNSGGSAPSDTGLNRRGGGGGGATGAGQAGTAGGGGAAGAGFTSTISGVSAIYGAGGYGMGPDNGAGTAAWTSSGIAYGGGGQGENTGHDSANVISNPGQNGVVVVRFYTP